MDLLYCFCFDIWQNLENFIQDDLFSSIFGGVITGLTAIFIYMFQKRMEKKTNTYDVASTLKVEIKRMIEINELTITKHDRGFKNINISDNKPNRIPNNGIYLGLLNSGNIKYIDMQDELDELYMYFNKIIFKIDTKLALTIIDYLDNIEEKNREYRKKFLNVLKL